MLNTPPKNFLICTAKFSDNLGDGVISDCTEYLVKRASPGASINHIDIAGRVEYRSSAKQDIKITKKIFFFIPHILQPLMTFVAWHLFMKKRLDAAWSKNAPDESFLLLFGGGQLVSDLALNFPLKFHHLISKTKSINAKLATNAIGVSSKMSSLGRRLYNSSFSSDKWIHLSVRDQESQKAMQTLVNDSKSVALTVDPALWTKECYSLKNERTRDNSENIGLGIAHPVELSAHIEKNKKIPTDLTLKFWTDLAIKLVEAGKSPILFSNGSVEDVSFCQEVYSNLAQKGYASKVELSATPLKPVDLVKNINRFHAVISHRLHANIIANSLLIPTVQLGWDAKVKSFAKMMGRESSCFEQLPSASVAFDAIESILQTGIDESHLNKLKQISFDNISEIVKRYEA
ncbi:polysaccharide pyruvyl transferase family protein [Pseudomonas fluorescens]|uniref:polysaccharide pyruvyl transferase family protein n=1 Tax=Pseudomonas fluorescens TaxID=294 RepID=UPI002ACAB90F|nr:polysaccharide pyruvyl transferase family protein [Pseudomonas fluorescens]MDZ5436679.1 polysaccharide pyruvyl transferase family protein [Pseudomonas fluorescens]